MYHSSENFSQNFLYNNLKFVHIISRNLYMNWNICQKYSERVYISHYFSDFYRNEIYDNILNIFIILHNCLDLFMLYVCVCVGGSFCWTCALDCARARMYAHMCARARVCVGGPCYFYLCWTLKCTRIL